MAHQCIIGELERLLLSKYPAQYAESWDRTGLLVGDPSCSVTGVATTLDPSIEAVEQAKRVGANVLLTHHPAFLQPPEIFVPKSDAASHAGSLVYAAIESGVALMDFHTALDMHEDGVHLLPCALGFDYVRTVLPLAGQTDTGYGYGALCEVRGARFRALGADHSQSVGEIARLCKEILGGHPRIWGDVAFPCHRVITAQGSAGSVLAAALAENVDCLICGELKYHDALAYAQAGLHIIELGHDVSERLFARVLCQTVKALGVENVVELETADTWTCV